MDAISQLETMFAFLLASFNLQVGAIHFLDRSTRPQFLSEMKQLTCALEREIEAIESVFVAQVENESERILDMSASLVHAVDGAKKADRSISEKIPRMVGEIHKNLTSSLSLQEQKSTDRIRSRFDEMKQKVSLLRIKIDNLY